MMKNLKSPKGGATALIVVVSTLLASNYFASHQSKARLSTLIKEFHSGLHAKNNTQTSTTGNQ